MRPLLPFESLIPVGYLSATYFPITKWWQGEALSLEIPGKFQGRATSQAFNRVKITGRVLSLMKVSELDQLVHQRVGRSGKRLGPIWVSPGDPTTPPKPKKGKGGRKGRKGSKGTKEKGKGFPFPWIVIGVILVGAFLWLLFRK